MPIYELINPSDPYTFEAPSIDIAGACVALLSPSFGAKDIDTGESTPLLFGWQEWLQERGINADWIDGHRTELADAFDSFIIGPVGRRKDVESMLAMLTPEKRQEWRDQRQDRERSSMSRIGEKAYAFAKRFRELMNAAATAQ